MDPLRVVLRLLAALASAILLCAAVPIVHQENADERGEKFEGDIALPPGGKSGIISPQLRWPNNQLVYQLDPNFGESERKSINAAFSEISSKTCISFVERTSETDYVYIQRGGSGSGCWSYVGRLGGRQELNLQPSGCVSMGIAAHELIHAIGFYHEHSRTDRDEYVAINWDNIQAGRSSAFNKYSASQVELYGVPYDYESIMHYSSYAFAKDYRLPTITPKDPAAALGQRNRLSNNDALKINRMYGCA